MGLKLGLIFVPLKDQCTDLLLTVQDSLSSVPVVLTFLYSCHIVLNILKYVKELELYLISDCGLLGCNVM
jgi:hypothetical protein